VASTSVHFPEAIVESLDRLAKELGISRNRLIVEACRRVVGERDRWPSGFFSNDHLSSEDLLVLENDEGGFAASVLAARRNRAGAPL